MLLPKLKKIIANNKNAVIWSDTSHESFKAIVWLKKQFPDIFVFTEFSEFLDIHQYNKGNFLQRRQATKRQLYFEQKAFKAYNAMALMTKTLMAHYERFPQPRPLLLHLPMTVDLERFCKHQDPPLGYKKPYIAFVGVMNDAKDGVNILIEAFGKVASEFPSYRLYLVGAWNYDTPKHKQLIQSYGFGEKVFWQGECARDQIPSIIQNADILALPRPQSKQAQGGFPTKLGEYLATGNPVCCTRVGEIPDYLKDGESVFFAEPGSVESFANTLQKALRNPKVAREIGLKGRQVAEVHFNKDIQAKKLFDFLISSKIE